MNAAAALLLNTGAVIVNTKLNNAKKLWIRMSDFQPSIIDIGCGRDIIV